MFSVSEIAPHPSSKRQKGHVLLNAATKHFSSEARIFEVKPEFSWV